jgi:alkanesulfonate monooxygenase
MLAYRSGLMQPATFVQQINTLSALIDGRVSLNIVAGSSTAEQRGYGDFLAHDERYARADEFLAVCHRFWRDGDVDFDGSYYRVEKGRVHTPFHDGRSPEIYISGHSEQSERLAATHGSSWLRVADAPQKVRDPVARMRAKGLGVCLRACVICRDSYDEAVDVAQSLIPQGDIGGQGEAVRLKDSSAMHAAGRASNGQWITRNLWSGLVPYYGPVWTTLVGTPDELSDTLLEYARLGVSEFILSGWPEVDTVDRFGSEVIPRVRRQEVH